MREKKIFIFEFVSGGGFNKFSIPSSLFCEGYGMLRSIIADFKSLDFEISTFLDYRGYSLLKYLNADKIKKIEAKDDYKIEFKEEVKNSEYCFIIAPEFSNILYDLTKIANFNNCKILSIDLEGIKLATSKIKTFKIFNDYNIKTPETFLIPKRNNELDLDFIIKKYNVLNAPIIIKPDDGVGAEAIYYFDDLNRIYNFFADLDKKIDINRDYILQKFINGDDLSISLIGNSNFIKFDNKSPLILSINSQEISIKSFTNESEYKGGCTPLNKSDKIYEKLRQNIKKIDFSKFSGYFGIDFIREPGNSIHFIEINPRLTTSYIGIRNIINKNPAELIWDAKMDKLDSVELTYNGFSQFLRIEFCYNGEKDDEFVSNYMIPKLIKKIPEMITPPICFKEPDKINWNQFSSFIATKEKDLNSSKQRLKEILKIFEKSDFSQIN